MITPNLKKNNNYLTNEPEILQVAVPRDLLYINEKKIDPPPYGHLDRHSGVCEPLTWAHPKKSIVFNMQKESSRYLQWFGF